MTTRSCSPPPGRIRSVRAAVIDPAIRRLAAKLKLRSTRLHLLRHYSATELVAAGVDLRTVAGRLGHGSSGATTLKVYAAWVYEADRRAATTIASVMPKPVPVQAPRGPYEQIAEAIRDDIRTGRLKPGDQLPTVAELAVTNTVAVGTALGSSAEMRGTGDRCRLSVAAILLAGVQPALRPAHRIARSVGGGCRGSGSA